MPQPPPWPSSLPAGFTGDHRSVPGSHLLKMAELSSAGGPEGLCRAEPLPSLSSPTLPAAPPPNPSASAPFRVPCESETLWIYLLGQFAYNKHGDDYIRSLNRRHLTPVRGNYRSPVGKSIPWADKITADKLEEDFTAERHRKSHPGTH